MWVDLAGVCAGRRAGQPDVPILRGITLSVERGEYLAILGPSGSGKSWLLFVLAGLVRPEAGHYWLDGMRVDALSEARLLRLRARRIGFVFENAALIPELSALMMLEHLAPWDYHGVRSQLGHGSGFDSPGFRRIHDLSPRLAAAFEALIARRGVSLWDVYRHSEAHMDVFELAECLVDWDERLVLWRKLHLKLVERVIGGHVIGTQGTPVEVLGRRLDVRYFQSLWDIRNRLTGEAGTSPLPTRV